MSKKYDFWTLPPYLIFHINRFQEIDAKNIKISTHIDFSINELDLTSYCIGPNRNMAIYSAYGILVNIYQIIYFNNNSLGA